MAGNFSYLFFGGIFCLPLLVVLLYFHEKIIQRNIKVLALINLFVFLTWPIADEIGYQSQIWAMNPEKILPIHFSHVRLEDIVWGQLATTTLAIVVILMATYYSKGVGIRKILFKKDA